MNRILIIGIAKENKYLEAILQYTDPENLECYSVSSCACDDLYHACRKLHADLKIIDKDVESYGFTKFLCFCDDVGLEAVQLLEECVKNSIDIIFINPKTIEPIQE